MARRKNKPEAVKLKCRLSERLHEVRVELFGERGGSEMARRLSLPVRTWYNYEAGVTVPAEVLLRFMELTAVEPMWLLHGRGPKFRTPPPSQPEAAGSVRDLLRTALKRLEQQDRGRLTVARPVSSSEEEAVAHGDVALERVEGTDRERLTSEDSPRFLAAHEEWQAAAREARCVRVDDDAMAPIVSEGAYVAFSDAVEPYGDLVNDLVVAWVDGRPMVRWFGLAGRFGLLRAENPAEEPGTVLLDLDAPSDHRKVRRVIWLSTPH